jgi:hypothetical protein
MSVYTQVISSSKPVMDFSKYARPELVTAVSRVADFFGDAVQSVAVPPACLVFVTLLLSYFLPFSSTLACVLFLVSSFLDFLFNNINLISQLDNWHRWKHSYWVVVS